MSDAFELDAVSRADMGKGASRRLRRENLVPAIVYGGKGKPSSITLEHRHVIKAVSNEAFFSHPINLKVDGKGQTVLVKDLQRHPYKPIIMHMDFQRVSASDKVHRHVTLHFIGEETSQGVKKGGVVSHQMKDLEIVCTVANLPEYIEVDVAGLDLDEVLHLSDLKLPKGVKLATEIQDKEHDLPVVTIHLPRAAVEETEEAEEAEAAPEEAAPESGEESAE